MGRIILASGSPRRQWLLRQIGLEPEVVVSQVEELMTDKEPDWMVRNLALRKAEDVAARVGIGGAAMPVVVIGADTVVAVDGRILGKPASVCEAELMIGLLQGRSHQVFTGVAMIFGNTGEKVVFAEKTDVYVYPMSREQIVGYVATGEPMDKAGGYGIQGYFAAYIQGIKGDYNNVVGLPVSRLCQELMARGMWNLDIS
ncbi:septum formation protein Maf [Clostridiaceae bacterium]|jgi:MAF protein|nr:septum formation protein Maf [Lachnospiraceae bacterium]NBH19003.1 septum formation protein Maf [Clostridiaceae bacterium]